MARRLAIGVLGVWLGFGMFCPTVFAQEPAPIPQAPPRAEGAYPPNPFGFFRGHGPPELLQAPRAIGLYFDSWILILLGVFFLLWVRTSYWVSRDSSALKLSSSIWNLVFLLCGFAGFVAVLLLPRFYGLLPMLALYGLPMYAYVRLRNSRVPSFSKVMTPRHLVVLLLRQLSWFGVRLHMPGFEETALGVRIRFLGKSDDRTAGVGEAISRQVENSPNYVAAKDLILRALHRRSSDIHLEPKEGQLAVRFRVDGLMTSDESFDMAQGRNIINIFKILCALDITERRRPQDGSFRAEVEDREIDFRVATQGTQLGEKLTLRILDPENAVRDLEELGFRKSLYEEIRQVIAKPHGLILVAGPAGAGKSTTLHAAINDLDLEQRNVITIEDPVEYQTEGITQIGIRTSEGQTFGETLRNVLRQDPDVVMIGEIRDGETANVVCEAAHTGHLVFSTVHAVDSIAAVLRLLELGAEPSMFSDALSLMLAQRLVRRLCSECKEEYEPTQKELLNAGLPSEDISVLYCEGTNADCRLCKGTGYYGQVGVFESLPLTEEIRNHLTQNPSPTSLRLAARNNGFLTLKEEGLRLVARGVTSLEELTRAVG